MTDQAQRNFRLTVAYDGTDFHGWQSQAGTRTVQGVLETAVSRVVCEHVSLAAASRTDAGVHARGQVANFHTMTGIATDHLLRGINSLLPEDVVVTRVDEAEPGFSSRRATGKQYQYRIWRAQIDDPFIRRHHLHSPRPMDVGLMRQAAQFMTGTLDFRGLQVNPGKVYDSTVRTVSAIELREEGSALTIDVFGTAFLYKQVRSMVGMLRAVGRGYVRLEQVPALVSGAEPKRRSDVVPPHGLTLMEVYYRTEDARHQGARDEVPQLPV